MQICQVLFVFTFLSLVYLYMYGSINTNNFPKYKDYIFGYSWQKNVTFSFHANSKECVNLSYDLKGNLTIRSLPKSNSSSKDVMDIIAEENPDVQLGGHFSPRQCNKSDVPRESVAIVIPYRDRVEHLFTFLQHIHPILVRQKLDYKIYLLNQYGNDPFNRGKLINIGFREAMKEKNWTCFIMHDVDYLPLNDNNFYTCWNQPRRLIVASSRWNYGYARPYKNFFGGVAAIKPEQFELVNGFYNEYYGWGAEDDDLALRIGYKGMRVKMLDEKEGMRVGKYQMLSHERAEPAKDRMGKLKRARFNSGTNGLNNLQYEIVSKIEERLYTNITVNVLYNATKHAR